MKLGTIEYLVPTVERPILGRPDIDRQRSASCWWGWFLLGFAAFLSILFNFDALVPFRFGTVLLLGLTITALILCRTSPLSLLSRLMIVLFALPFSNLCGYLLFESFDWWDSPIAIVLSSDTLIMDTMVHLGLIGLAALAAGLAFVRPATFLPRTAEPSSSAQGRSLPLFFFYLMLAIGVLLCYLSTPEETIFDRAYATLLTSWAETVNFNGAGLVGFTFFIALGIDFERSPSNTTTGLLRGVPFVLSLFLVVVVFQIFRGDRESLGLIAGLLGLLLTSPRATDGGRILPKKRLVGVAAITILVLFVFVGLGSLRFTLSEGTSGSLTEELAEGLKQNTWSAVLLNNLGSAAQYQHDQFELLWGKTYLDYALSLPPGFVTSYLGYRRPLELDEGPNWWFQGISSGGMHALVVPFHNFGSFGVLGAMVLSGMLIGMVDSRSTRSFWSRLMFAGFLIFSFQWFWYGDMNFIRGVMSIMAVGLLYQCALTGFGLIRRSNRSENFDHLKELRAAWN